MMFLKQRSPITGLVLSLILISIGCNQVDYELLLEQQKTIELKKEKQILEAELRASRQAAMNAANFTPESSARNKSLRPSKPKLPAIGPNEAETRADLETQDAFFSTDSDGAVVECDLSQCQDLAQVISSLKQFPRLKKVALDGTKVDDAAMDVLAGIEYLEHLEIPRSTPSVDSLEKLKNLKHLKFLQLARATISNEAFEIIAQFPSIQQIRCSQTRIGDAELQYLANTPTLRAIDLTGCNRVSIAGVESLSKCPNLSFLKIWGANIDDECMEFVGQMKKLQVLGLNDTRVTDVGMQALAGLNLKEIHLFRTQIGDDGLKVVAEMPNVQSLNLRDTRLTDAGVELLSNLRQLKRLDLSESNSPGITDACGPSLAKMTNLERLNLWSTRFSDAGLSHLSGLEKLVWLNLDNTQVTDESIEELTALPQLRWLHLGKTAITDRAVPALLKLNNLKYLNISKTKISEDSYYDLDDHFSPMDCDVIAP